MVIGWIVSLPVGVEATGPEAAALPATVAEKEPTPARKTLTRTYDPVEIRGETLRELLGRELNKLKLYTFSDGSIHQVPYQFDEWSDTGSMVLDQGDEANADQGNGVLDPEDMLVFMARETGDRVSREAWPKGADSGIQIEITDPLTGGRGWCSLLHFSGTPPEVSFPLSTDIDDADRYVAQGETYTVVGSNHTIGKRVYKTVMNDKVLVKKKAGGDGKNFIDRSKVRVSARMFFGKIKLGFNEDDFIGEVSKYKQGPVRSIGRQWAQLTLPLGLKSPRFFGDVYIYDTIILIVAETNVKLNPKYLLTDYRMVQGYDLNPDRGYGMRFYNSNNPEGFIVDGRTSPQESRCDQALDRWRCIVGPNGWMVHRSMWDPQYSSQADIKVHYTDDLLQQDPPDHFPGNLGYYYVDSTIRSLEPRKYSFQLEWYWPYDFFSPEGLRMDLIEQIMNIRDHPLRIVAGGREAVNTGGTASLLEP